MAFDFPSSPTLGQVFTPVSGTTYVWNGYAWALSSASNPNYFGPPQGRLTLDTSFPVMTTTQAGKTAISYVPHVGDKVPIYNGTAWSMTPLGASSISIGTIDTSRNPSVIGASKVNDWFIWDGGASPLYISHGPDWTDDVTRSAGTALVRVNGIWLNNASITNGPAAQRGTYVGTTRSNASSQLDWIFGGIAAGGVAGFLGVWNAYNRVNVSTMVGETLANWSYNGAPRPANGSANMRVSAVFGLAEDATNVAYACPLTGGTSVNGSVGVGIDSIIAMSGQFGFAQNPSVWSQATGRALPNPLLGFHFWQAMEYSSGATSTFAGQVAPQWQNGLFFDARM